MGQLETDAHLLGLFLINRPGTDNNKPCDILPVVAEILAKNGKSVEFSRFPAGDSCTGEISLLLHHLRRSRSIGGLHSLPSGMGFQIFSALGEGLGMRIHCLDLRDRGTGDTQKDVIGLHHLFTYNIKLVLSKKIIDISDNSLSGIFDGKDRIIRPSCRDFLHGVTEGLYMIVSDFVWKICTHGRVTVGSLHSLKDNRHIVQRKAVRHMVVPGFVNAFLCKKLVLAFPADRHHLLEQFLHPERVELAVGLGSQRF